MTEVFVEQPLALPGTAKTVLKPSGGATSWPVYDTQCIGESIFDQNLKGIFRL